MENPIKMDDLEVPLFSETSKWRYFTLLPPGLREVWSFTSLESNLEVGATLGDVGPLDSSAKATPEKTNGERSGWVVRRETNHGGFLGVYIWMFPKMVVPPNHPF